MADKIKIILQAKDQTKAAFKSVNKSMSKLNKASSALGVSLGPVAAFATAGALVAIGKQALGAADEIQKMSQRLAISTEALSQYKHVAKLSGTDFEALAKGVAKSQRTIADAEDGLSTAVRAIEDMGLSVAELKKLKPEDAFEKMGAAMSGIVDPYTRASVAANVFGRAGKELLPIFNDGAAGVKAMRMEADRLGLTLSQDMADSAAKAADAGARLESAWSGFAQALTIKVAPALTTVGNMLATAFSDEKVSHLMQELEKTDKPFHNHLRRMSASVGGLSDEWVRAALAAHAANEVFSMVNVPGFAGAGLGTPDESYAPPVADMVQPVKDTTIAWNELDEAIYNLDEGNKILATIDEWGRLYSVVDGVKEPLSAVGEQAMVTADIMQDAGEQAAEGFSDAIVDAAIRSGDALESLGSIAKSVFSTILSGFLKMGISSLMGPAAPLAYAGIGPSIGGAPLGKSMATGDKSGGGTTINGGITVNANSTLNTDPMSIRKLATQIQDEIIELGRHRS